MQISHIAKSINAQLLQLKEDTKIQYLLFDSRKISFPQHSLFFAIPTKTRNGHEFIQVAYQKGVRNFVISQADWSIQNFPEANFISVKNSIAALQLLATHHRKQFDFPIIGITGSNGKTVVKEWLYQLLWQDYHIVRSPKSYNSQIGVPLSVWQINAQHNLGIFEAGISQVDEMHNLAAIICPTIGIFTNIGTAHSKGFTNNAQKVEEKLKLFQEANTLLYCSDYASIHQLLQPLEGKKKNNLFHQNIQFLTWGRKKSISLSSNKTPFCPDLQIIHLQKSEKTTHIGGVYLQENHQIAIPFTDEASIENAIHCWLLLLHFGYSNEVIAERMSQLAPIAMRLELKQGSNNCLLINDTYNSDLHSLSVALDFLEQQRQYTKHTVILSDILQSGQNHRTLYQQVAHLLEGKNIHRLIGIGAKLEKYRAFFQGMETLFYPTTQAFLQAIPHFREERILVKGARTFAFEKITNALSQKSHSTVLEIKLNAITHNLKVYRQLLQPLTKIMVMVKALSYGSGSFEVANLLQYQQVDYLGVAYTDEGVALRKAGITLPIMVLNPSPSSFDALLQYQIEPEIYSLWQLEQLEEHLVHTTIHVDFPIEIHLKLDTGMHRLGFETKDLPALVEHLQNNPRFRVASILSHLSASDEAQHDGFSHEQIQLYEQMFHYLQCKMNFEQMPIRHILNSTGITRFTDCQMEMVRLGLGLYGVDGSLSLQPQLQCVSVLKTYISQIKEISSSETVGYGRKGKVSKTSRIATVNIGYGDGLPRRLSNGKGKMWIRGQFAPIIGNVCMDMTMLDVTHLEEVQAGDEVEVFGENLSVQQVAEWLETIPYEVMTNVSSRVKRVYFQE